ncbi:diaminopropionate ammonia-lyase [Kiloniella spongiae]|uniref:Diaminopropionate ammonia-lyase n=1 Tax=Kiloniella spongiae TaxID=1489064 RepID=A0A0H2MJ46_9PROT|nr:diaminopropionate ammonia-lyase [Kiloniella spongiae]KLN60777.1 diaminopropionate ammonia-lyase [Kiloniella spongiae]
MLDTFSANTIKHVSYNPHTGNAFKNVIKPQNFADASNEITSWDGYTATPLHRLENLAQKLKIQNIFYKDEGPRFGLGSFKALGGAYAAAKVLQREIKNKFNEKVTLSNLRTGKYASLTNTITLVSATDGNHGRSLAWGAQQFGAACKIYIHTEVSEERAKAMRSYGADVIRIDGDYDDSVRIAKTNAEANGWFIVSDTSWENYTQPPTNVMAGYGVMTNEIIQELPFPPSHVLLQGGVGGLAASVCAALRQKWGKDSPRVIIVEPDLANCLYTSAIKDAPTSVQITDETIMAGLSCGDPSPLAWDILREEASDFISIPDTLIAPAMKLLAKPIGNDPTIVAGESAVAGLAAIIAVAQDETLRKDLDINTSSQILLIGSEGATDKALYHKIISS